MITYHEKALVSACLLGVRCRYDGGHSRSEEVLQLQDEMELIPICPEQNGGLPTPRPAVQCTGGDGYAVLDGTATVTEVESGIDHTSEMLRGAETALDLAKFYKAKHAYLKSRSPSCGCGTVWIDGEISSGDGVTAALLKRNGITVHEMGRKKNG